MRIKKELIILIAIIIALSIYLTLRNRDRTRYVLPELPALSSKEVSKIEVSRKASSFTLEKKDNQWVIPPKAYPADMIIVNNMLEMLEKLTITTLVSESKSYERYGLDEDNRVSVKAWADGTLKRDFDIGKEGPSSRLTYIRLSGDHRVFHATEDFRWKFDQKISELRDSEVLSFDREKINKIEIARKGTSLILSRQQTPADDNKQVVDEGAKERTQGEDRPVWTNAEGRVANQETVDEILKMLSELSCEKYIEEDDKKIDSGEPEYFFRLTADKEYTLSVFAEDTKEGGMFPAISSGSKYSFMLSKENIEKITRDPFEEKKEPEKTETDVK